MKNLLHASKNIMLMALVFITKLTLATGEPSTYFNIFVPPNNDNVQRNVCLVVTAIYDSTSFSIIDDGMDGDTDDSKSGLLMAGQSYILYIKDNGINDDAKYASGGVLKQDGDYFIITSNKIVYASQSTNSDWQHDWVPATNKTGIGQKFIIYAPKVTTSSDLNAFVYQDSTEITIRKISTSPNLQTGYTNVNMYSQNIIVQKVLNVGKDLIYSGTEGRNILVSGETYVVESNKPITLQYGSLYVNERDGGGYVPSSNGSSAGDLFYFGVPFQSGTSGEQEIRIVSLNSSNNVTLERYSSGIWVSVKSWTMNANSAVDWVGRNNGNINYPTVFRVKCSIGKKVSVFEADWLETGSPGTSDIGTMCSSFNGTSSGKDFLIYMAPPGNEYNVRNPFTNALFGQQLTHAYLFASNDTCHVYIKDAYTNGNKLSRVYTILPGKYVDCYLTLTEWKNIYNGTGTIAGGPERPYLSIKSDKPISVMNTNFNDNWMMYFGSSLEQSFTQTSTSSKDVGIPGDTLTVTSNIIFKTPNNIDSASISVNVGSGVQVISSVLNDINTSNSINGTIKTNNNLSAVTFPTQNSLIATHNYQITTTIIPKLMYNDGGLVQNNTVVSVETILEGNINGTYQQSSTTTGLKIASANTSNLLFQLATFSSELTNSWTSNSVDIDNDGWEDLFVTDVDNNKPNLYYKNNGNKTFTKTIINNLTTDLASTVCSSWADFNNDGKRDVLIVNNTQKPNALFINNGNQSFQKITSSPVTNHPAYFHSGSFADYDNDGWVDIFVSNYMPTKFNELYHNNGDGTFSQVNSGSVVSESFMSLGATWADYDNDGDQDLFIPNSNNVNNSFFMNNGNSSFTKNTNLIICNDAGNSVGSCWGDINNDGWLDLFVANASGQNNFLYLNNKNGGFSKVTSSAVVNDGGHSHGCSFVDIDNDMDLDLYVTNDIGTKFLYINDGQGNFTRKKDEVLEGNYGKSFGQSWFDADKDGDMDLFVATHSGQSNYFFLNNGNSNNWTNIKLVGTTSNRDAIGARISIKCGDIWQCREINSQSGLGGQSSIRAHFGLGSNTTIDSVIIKWPSGRKQYLKNLPSNTFNTITEPSGAVLKGIVYFDSNNNCVKDVNETPISNVTLNIDNSQSAISNSTGKFSASINTGSHTITVNPQGYWYNACGSASFTVNALNDTTIINVPLSSTASGADLKVNLATTVMRRGFKNQVNMTIENVGSLTAYNVPLTLKLVSGMCLTKATPMYQSLNSNVYTWNIDSLKSGQTFNYDLLDSVYLTKKIGDNLTFEVNAILNNDLNQDDNSLIQTISVVGAIDPNDLLVSPKGEGEGGYIKQETTLTYTIRFQNIGNYLASNVLITDRLPEGIDFNQIKFISSSHTCNFNIVERNMVQIHYENINLPDSSSNLEASQGFITFSVPLLKDLQAGFLLENQAEIQFDFEDPLTTNKVNNTITLVFDKEILLAYPNPTSSKIRLQLITSQEQYQSGNYIKEVKLFDARGILIKTMGQLEANSDINLQDYSSGLYYILVIDSTGTSYREKVLLSK